MTKQRFHLNPPNNGRSSMFSLVRSPENRAFTEGEGLRKLRHQICAKLQIFVLYIRERVHKNLLSKLSQI